MKSKIYRSLLICGLTFALPIFYACGTKPAAGTLTKASTGYQHDESNPEPPIPQPDGTTPDSKNENEIKNKEDGGETSPIPSTEVPMTQLPKVIIINPGEAIPPTPVAGAASEITVALLDCRSSADKLQVVCKLTGVAAAWAKRPLAIWTLSPADGAKEISLTASKVIIADGKTTYYVFDQQIPSGYIRGDLTGLVIRGANTVSFGYNATSPQTPFVLPTAP